MITLRTVAWLGLMGAVTPALGDHVLLRNGDVLFNVSLVDNISTAARPLKVIYRPNSYLLKFRTNTPVWLGNQISGQFNVADYITTSSEVKDKRNMHGFIRARQWQEYEAPPPPQITMPTPEPTPVITPVPRETPLPVNVASTSMPLEQRVHAQEDMFMQEQQKLARDIRTSLTAGQLTDQQASQLRIQWLQAQRQVLEQFYPRDEQIVRDAKAEWERQLNEVKGLGRFRFED
jgi:hypothetical protein